MDTVIYVSHPEVVIDPTVPVPEWGLSPKGVARMHAFKTSPLFAGTRSVWSSGERKAREAGDILATARGLLRGEDGGLGENDRSATGFVPPPRFNELADAFFANPDESIFGWETARAAQARVMAAIDRVRTASPHGDIAIVAHGGVGALTLAALYKQPISRKLDQTGQGNWFAFERHTLKPLSSWAPLPEVEPETVR